MLAVKLYNVVNIIPAQMITIYSFDISKISSGVCIMRSSQSMPSKLAIVIITVTIKPSTKALPTLFLSPS